VLLALRPGDLTIAQASENCELWLGKTPEALLGQGMATILGGTHAARLRELVEREPLERNPFYAFTVEVSGAERAAALDVTVHTADGVILVEMEPASRGGNQDPDYFGLVLRTMARLQAAPTLREFFQVAAAEVRQVTGLDRVMVYRFHPDDSGEVFAEDKRDNLAPWLGLRYPADDIPKPAREIFKKIWIRPLPDASAEMQEMVPLANPDTGRPLEMTHCALRGASVMYTEYLRNMGVAASLTMSILRDGELWGLIACHHYTRATLPYPVRAAAELLAQMVSLQLRSAEDREHWQYRARLDTAHQDLLAKAAGEGGLALMAQGQPNLLDGIEATGAAIYDREQWWTTGVTPAAPQLDALGDWLRTRPELDDSSRPFYATDRLAIEFPPAAAYPSLASGLLAIPVSRGQRSLILWFRPERTQTFCWAGNPYEKPTTLGPHGPRLTPRRSFELWQEHVVGRSTLWTAVEIEAAVRLRLLAIDLIASRAEQLAALNEELARSNEELDAFAYVASHDLKEPLRGLHKYAHYLLDEAQAGRVLDTTARERIETMLRLTVRMDGLLDALLHFSRMGRLKSEPESTSLAEVLQEAVEMLGAQVAESGAEIRVVRPMPSVWCDRIRIREVFSNLISNALKYNDKPEKWVEVGFVEPDEPTPEFFDRASQDAAHESRVFYVRDNGIGIPPRHHEQVFQIFKRLHPRDAFGGGSGAGLTIARKLVEQHGGRIWLASTAGEGTTFFFTLPGDSQGEPGTGEAQN
jgi:light-regulated signal transduction histidine kinase (bacteriophytochrome)